MIEYNKLKEKCTMFIKDKNKHYDINMIIPVRGRENFAKPMYESYRLAKEKTELSVTYTVVEHSVAPKHMKFCRNNNIDYIWIATENGRMFNKCLCFNIGALYSSKSKYMIFHDIDCLIQSDFFNKVYENIKKKNCKAIQTFQKRRVLYLNDNLTNKAINNGINRNKNSLDIDLLNENSNGVSHPQLSGAPGGSILVEKDLFFNAGGYDDDLFFAYSPEDAYFWEKIDTIDKMCISDDPPVEIFHMSHKPQWKNNPFLQDMEKVYKKFKNSNKNDKLKKIKGKSNHIKQFLTW